VGIRGRAGRIAPHNPPVWWLVLDMDEGLLRREASRADAVTWMTELTGGRVLSRDQYRPGRYGYRIGLPDADRVEFWFVERADDARDSGEGADQAPLYPHRARPYERVERVAYPELPPIAHDATSRTGAYLGERRDA
jgi:hypothetical protein